MLKMGIDKGPRQQEPTFRPLVAFDFDGTLTTKDSFTDFLAWRAGAGRYVAGLVRLTPELLSYLSDRNRDRGRLKASATRMFLKGVSRDELDASTRRYAEIRARKLLRPDAVRAWKRWQAQGAQLVIVTASPEPVVAPFARGLGCDLLLGTRLEFDARDRLTGRFDGPNCRGEEKVRRLQAVFGPEVRLEAAYGDTSGDTAMLALADEAGFKVFQGRP
ncbi:MAG TPA: HAD-IB family hydrolase [Caulobacteraceae bacterium]|jgi:phosphatidylglycerophosphatase C|nr:HAD-IB family hydrolase [Caulobacteraceae bacterium]